MVVLVEIRGFKRGIYIDLIFEYDCYFVCFNVADTQVLRHTKMCMPNVIVLLAIM